MYATGTRKFLLLLGIGTIVTFGCQADSSQPSDSRVDPASGQLELVDSDNRPVDPFGTNSGQPLLFLFTRTDCPISNRYAPEVKRLHDQFGAEVDFYLVYVDKTESLAEIRTHIRDYDYPCMALQDKHHALVALTGVEITPEAALYTAGHQLAYVGRIDNLYTDFGSSRRSPTKRDLENALQAVLSGHPIDPADGPAIGCYISDLKQAG